MTAKLSDVCTVKYGKDHKRIADGRIPVYGSGGIMRYIDTALYDKKSVLIPRKGTLDNLFFVNEPFWTVDTLFYTEIDETKVIPEYLYYFLKTRNLAGMNVGTAVPSLTVAVLNEIKIDVPSLSEQQIIADTLSALDARLAENIMINHHLEQMAQAIWSDRFGGCEPNSTLGDWFPVKTGKKDANIAKGGQYPFFSCSQKVLYTDEYSFDAMAILLAGNGDFNVKVYSGKFEAYQRTYVLIPNHKKHLGFLYYAIKQYLHEITAGFRGSVIRFITKGNIENFPIFMPNNDEVLDLFNDFVAQIAHKNEENDRLAALRDTLLPSLMSGELSVANVEDAK